MAAHVTARQRAREQITAEILESARRQLAEHGASALSLRSIARDLGMVSSAVYRYFASRDELLTQLIIEAYDSLGESTEADVAATAGRPAAERWTSAAATIRRWACRHPHQYLLVYGSPVPGYDAPPTTVGPGTRATRALLSIVGDAQTAGELAPPPDDVDVPADLAADLEHLGELVALPVPPATMVAIIAAWTQLFGLVSFELTSQTRGLVEQHEELFLATARLGARQIGLSPRARA
jgi:AcrR family transcriptional regulator